MSDLRFTGRSRRKARPTPSHTGGTASGLSIYQPVYLGSFDIKNTSAIEADARFERDHLLDASGSHGGALPEVRCDLVRTRPLVQGDGVAAEALKVPG